jgi:predicted regulator of Ras-like GTPase activity (Roadblock/LC7/MglB family)
MSAIAESVKFRFVGLLKQLRRRLDGSPLAPSAASPSAAPAPKSPSAGTPHPGPTPPAPSPATAKPAVGNQISIPFCAIVGGLPMELRARVKVAETTGLLFPMPVEKILPQLASGVVKVTFGELRQALPQAFAPGNGCDQVEVVLPLNEILAQLNPALLPRRTGQKQLTVPSHVPGPFEHGGRGVTFSVGKPQSEPAAPPPSGAPAPIARTPAPAPSPAAASRPHGSHPFSQAPGSAPPPPPAAPPKPASRPVVRPPEDVPAEIFRRAPAAGHPAPQPPPATPRPVASAPALHERPLPPTSAAPARSSAVTPPTQSPVSARSPSGPLPGAKASEAVPAAAAQNGLHPAAAKPTATPAVPSGEEPTLSVELSAVLGNWPEGLRQEIVQRGLAAARLALPLSLVESGLKQGRAVFSWKVLRSYLQPAATAGSPFDATELELPLSVLAPLFIAHKKAQPAPKRRLTVDDTIPDLFFGVSPTGNAPTAPAPSAESTPAAIAETAPASPAVSAPSGPRENKVVDTNYYVWDDVNEVARVDETEFKRRPTSSGTDFIVKYATPNEIVSRAAALDGVAGALIALPDGLLVASRIPPDLNADTLAAFLPQIFAKVTQCTKELRMGELNNLAFTVGNVPWKIFRVNAIFFAAFGRAGEALPTAPLAALAAELDRRQR